MSSKSLYIGLFFVAGLNLSFWGQPLQAEQPSRFPASNCTDIAGNLLKGQTDMSCSRTETEFDREANSNVQSSTIYETGADGQQVKKGISVQIATEANCDSCNLSTGTKAKTLVFGVDQLKDFNNVQQQILAAAEEQEEEALNDLRKEITLKKAIENCIRDSSGEKLDKEDKAECLAEKEEEEFERHLEKMADMDDEEAERYFNLHLKADLEKKALSNDPAERAMAIEALESIQGQIYSDVLTAKIEMMISASKEIDNIAQATMSAQTKLAIAANLPQGHPQKQFLEAQAKEIMGRADYRVQNLKVNTLTALGSSNDPNAAAGLKEAMGYLEKIEMNLTEAYASSQELAALKVGGTPGQGTETAQDVNSNSRLARGGIHVPGGHLIVIPKATVPQNSSQTGLPNAHNLGRGVSQDRLPAPLAHNQFQQPVQHIQPMPLPAPVGSYQYNPFQPMGPQFTGNPPTTVLPRM